CTGPSVALYVEALAMLSGGALALAPPPHQHGGLAPEGPAGTRVKSSQPSSARNRHKCCIATGACGRWQVRSGREDQQRSVPVRHTLAQLPSTPPRSTVRFELLFFRNAAASWTGRPGRRITPRS